jgi:hypothetical protein
MTLWYISLTSPNEWLGGVFVEASNEHSASDKACLLLSLEQLFVLTEIAGAPAPLHMEIPLSKWNRLLTFEQIQELEPKVFKE